MKRPISTADKKGLSKIMATGSISAVNFSLPALERWKASGWIVDAPVPPGTALRHISLTERGRAALVTSLGD